MPDNICFIYGLIDPREPDLYIYAGRTEDTDSRYKSHIKKTDKRQLKVNEKVADIQRSGYQPKMEVFLKCSLDQRVFWEKRIVKHLRDKGHPLLNEDGGGTGLTSEQAKKRWENPEERKKAADKQRAYSSKPENKKKMSDIQKEVLERPGVKESISQGMKKFLDESPPEVLSKYNQKHADGTLHAKDLIAEKTKEAMKDPEILRKVSEGAKKQHTDPVLRARYEAGREKSQRTFMAKWAFRHVFGDDNIVPKKKTGPKPGSHWKWSRSSKT